MRKRQTQGRPGLLQLGPARWAATVAPQWAAPKVRKHSISTRVAISNSRRRKAPITLAGYGDQPCL